MNDSSIEIVLPETAGTSPAQSGERFVTFTLGSMQFAVLAAAVAEVTSILPVTPLPNTPPPVIGIAPLRGELVALLDLGNVLCSSTENSGAKSKTIILRSKFSNSDTSIGFPVDRVGEIATWPNSSIRPVGAEADPAFHGEIEHSGHLIRIIDLGKLPAFFSRSH